MAADAELTRLYAEKARVQASIDQIEADNTVQGSFGDVNIRRNEIRELNAQRDRVNARIQMRIGQLLKVRSPIWGSVIRATRCPPDGVDTHLGNYEIDAADLEPSEMSGGDDGDMDMNGGDMTPVDPNTLTSYFAAVDAPSDIATPEADVAALFTPAAFQAGTSFMGRDVEPPGNYDARKVEGFAVHPDLAFTHVIASPNALRQDVTSFYVRQSDVEIGGQTYHRFLAVRPGNWQNPTPDFLPTFNLHFRLEDN